MNRWTLLTICTAVLATIGCEKADDGVLKHSMNTEMLNYHMNDAVDQAAIRQQTIYPHHFVVNGAEFNDIGVREIGALSNHYRKYPGTLNVRRGDADSQLYYARVKAVTDAMSAAGVESERVTIGEGLPGGDGVTADRVQIIQERMNQKSS